MGNKKDIQTILSKEQNLASAKRVKRVIALRAQGDQRLEKRDQKNLHGNNISIVIS